MSYLWRMGYKCPFSKHSSGFGALPSIVPTRWQTKSVCKMELNWSYSCQIMEYWIFKWNMQDSTSFIYLWHICFGTTPESSQGTTWCWGLNLLLQQTKLVLQPFEWSPCPSPQPCTQTHTSFKKITMTLTWENLLPLICFILASYIPELSLSAKYFFSLFFFLILN